MKKLILIVSVLSAFALTAQTTISDSIYVGGMFRQYRVYVPAIYSGASAVPLVFNLHGYTSNNVQQEAYGDFRPIADTANFIIVHPNGTFDGTGNRYWNCWTSYGTAPNDVNFLSALIDSISASYNIDAARIYSTGLSNGGFMSNMLACFLGNRIAAVASVAAGMTTVNNTACSPSHPTPVMEIHGTSDAVVPYNGGTGMMHVDSVIKYWVTIDNCSSVPVQTSVPNTNAFDGCTATHFLYSNGSMGSTVELYKINGGGHTWPGAIAIPSFGNTCQDFKASAEIWRFFRKYNINDLTFIGDPGSLVPTLNIYPNPVQDKLSITSVAEIQSVILFDLSGKKIMETQPHGLSASLSFDTLERGAYIISVTVEGKNYRRIICH